MGPLILASASPRRRELLASAGVHFEVRPADVDESMAPGESALVYVRRVSLAKAMAVPGQRVLAADTVVAIDGDVLGKPATHDEACDGLRRLSGRAHQVHTAVTLRVNGRIRHRIVTSEVRFRPLLASEIDRYVQTGESFDKAGGYGIQGHGSTLVDRVRGSYTNVIGLPVRETLQLLERWGGR